MYILINILIVVAVFIFMEGVAWFTHKYIMHGFLWTWHRSHHTVHNHALERNDLFALVFSIPSILFIYFSTSSYGYNYMTSAGVGILCYGVFYFIFHDVIVHRRIKVKYKAKKHSYLGRMINAHYIHHEKHTKEGCNAFGFLYAKKKFAAK